METTEDLKERIAQLERQLKPISKTTQELIKIIFFEVLGTTLFAYGIISS